MTFQKVMTTFFTGRTLFFIEWDPINDLFWNKTGQVWETYDEGNLDDYVFSLTEKGTSGIYVADYPIPNLDILSTEIIYEQHGVQPNLSVDTPAIGLGQSQGSNIAAVSNDTESSENLSLSAKTMEQGEVQASPAPTDQAIATDLTSSVDNAYAGRVIIFTSGDSFRVSAIVKSYNAGTKLLTFTKIQQAPDDLDTFIIV
jgi:hypothetical protein